MDDKLVEIADEILTKMDADCEGEYADRVKEITEYCDHVASDKFSGTASAELGRRLLQLIIMQQKEILKLKDAVGNLSAH